MNRDLLDQYQGGPAKLRQSIAGLTPADLQAVPIPGKWSTQHVVIHLADAELAFADRIRRLVAMDDPALLAWDENKYSTRLFYSQQDVEDAVVMIEVIRRQTSRILQALPEQAFTRSGEHNERGWQSLEDVIKFAVHHLEHHLKFVAEKRLRLGK